MAPGAFSSFAACHGGSEERIGIVDSCRQEGAGGADVAHDAGSAASIAPAPAIRTGKLEAGAAGTMGAGDAGGIGLGSCRFISGKKNESPKAGSWVTTDKTQSHFITWTQAAVISVRMGVPGG